MVSSPVQNLSDFLKNRPPWVLFVLCLVTLAVCTFYFAFEIEKDGPTVNSDKEHDWIQMLKHFNELDTCINLSPRTNEMRTIDKDTFEEQKVEDDITVFTKVTVENLGSLISLSNIHGALSLEGWQTTSCPDSGQQPKNVEIYFDIPTLTKSSSSLELCVSVKGPAQFLPFVKKPLCRPKWKGDAAVKAVRGLLTSKLPGTYDPKFCENGNLTKLNFGLDLPEIENYLSDDVRTQIYIHLMWCSYSLVFIIFGILLYSIIRKSDYLEKKEQSARLL